MKGRTDGGVITIITGAGSQGVKAGDFCKVRISEGQSLVLKGDFMSFSSITEFHGDILGKSRSGEA